MVRPATLDRVENGGSGSEINPRERKPKEPTDGAHHLHLVEADVTGIGFAPRRPMVAEDIRDLQ
jgi:hypothetical protein